MASLATVQNLQEPEPRDVLKYLLGWIYRTRNRQIQLSQSLDELVEWMASPINTSRYTLTPKAHGIDEGMSVATIFQIAELENRYKAQQAQITQAVQRVIDLIDLLPTDSMERVICEMRHVQLMAWGDIAEAIPMSKRHVHRIYDGAIEALLQRPEVAPIIAAATDEYKHWDAVRRCTRRVQGEKSKDGVQLPKTKPGISSQDYRS